MSEPLESSFLEALRRSEALERELEESPGMHRVLTGDRPTGPLHLGHQFGSIANRVRLQNLGVESFIVIADYQVLTDRSDTSDIPLNVRSIVLDYLSLGLDPWSYPTYIFAHSQVPELHQLVLPFSMVVTISELERNPTMKEEIRASRINKPSVGMFIYPISQAADILFCKSTIVPVGKDQLPHIELTRKIANRCNERSGQEIFPEPSALLSKTPLILGLDGSQKMSKSRGNAIFLSMTSDEVNAAIKRAKTDSNRHISYEPTSRPEISNLVQVFGLCSGLTTDQVVDRFHEKGYADFKSALTEVINCYLDPIREKRRQFARDSSVVLDVLTKGIAVARERAAKTLFELSAAMNMSLDKYTQS